MHPQRSAGDIAAAATVFMRAKHSLTVVSDRIARALRRRL